MCVMPTMRSFASPISTQVVNMSSTWVAHFLSGVFPPGLSVSRASAGWCFGPDGFLRLCGNDSFRIDHVPNTGVPRGLLLEEARTNVVRCNRDLTRSVWGNRVNVSVTKDQTGIDGEANSASRVTATAPAAVISQSVPLASSQRFQTAFIKRISGNGLVEMTMDGLSWTPLSLGEGWHRVSIPSAVAANPVVGFRLASSGDSIAVDCVQNENGLFATSPIITGDSAVTRATDRVRVFDLSSIGFNALTGTVWVEFEGMNFTNGQHIFCFSDGRETDNNMRMYKAVGGDYFRVVLGGGYSDILPSSMPGLIYKGGIAYGNSENIGILNANTVVSPASFREAKIAGSFNRLDIGNSVPGSSPFNGWLRRMDYVSQRLENQVLAGF